MRLLSLIAAVAAVPALLAAYVYAAEAALRVSGRKVVGARGGRGARPWLWIAPALLIMAVFLVYPIVNTLVLSFQDAKASGFVGLANYAHVFTDKAMLVVLRNNLAWLVFFTLGTLGFGLVLALLSERIKWEAAAKAAVFIPMAISFVAAGVIWRFMFEYRPAGETQIGTVNAILSSLSPGFEPKAWLFDKGTNNTALIVVGIWMWTGFSMVILSAGLKGIPTETIEAARIDGATEVQIFFRVILPLASPTIAVVATTLMVNVLKIFDIVYVMTNGALGTEVIANRMYKELFNYRHFGRASAIAIVLLVAVAPVVALNIRRFRQGRAAHG